MSEVGEAAAPSTALRTVLLPCFAEEDVCGTIALVADSSSLVAGFSMTGFAAIVLICLGATPTEQCDESNALVVRSIHVANELGCSSGWQEIIARGGLQESLKNGNYVKTLCRRETAGQ